MNGVNIYAASFQVGFFALAAMPTKSIMWWDAVYLPSRYVLMVIDGNSVTFGGWNIGCHQSTIKVHNSAKKYKTV